nr:immunoglobulin light chain junction region [Macaca mulatta]
DYYCGSWHDCGNRPLF